MEEPIEIYSKAGITVSKHGPVQIIKFDNESKRNAINNEAYEVMVVALQKAAEDPTVVVTAFTGAGQYYSSGFDITASPDFGADLDERFIQKSVDQVRTFVSALIDHPKVLVSVVNGPAVGIAVTTLALCDLVLAANVATFRTPFSQLGLCAEGCSSYTFPRLLGSSRAARLLLFGERLTAQEALQCGLVAELFPANQPALAWRKVLEIARLPPEALRATKNLMRRAQADQLHRANRLETQQLVQRLTSTEFMDSVAAFLARRASKL